MNNRFDGPINIKNVSSVLNEDILLRTIFKKDNIKNNKFFSSRLILKPITKNTLYRKYKELDLSKIKFSQSYGYYL